jgi:transcriptional regulator with XRE-family HTH domain
MSITLFLTKNVLKYCSMQNKETFGEIIRKLREQNGLPIRKVAAHLDIDPSTLSKIERNERSANREHVKKLSELFKIDEKILLVNFLSDKVMYELINEEFSNEVLKVAEEKIKYLRSKNIKQSKLSL